MYHHQVGIILEVDHHFKGENIIITSMDTKKHLRENSTSLQNFEKRKI